MDFGPFILFSLFYAVVGVRVVRQLVARRRETFDRVFTAADRALVDQAAFFVLIPISVALHELGHAVTIRALGGTIEGWGYYGFAGFVGFAPTQFTEAERILIALAGTLVNLALGAAALALVFGRRPPMRAAFNELLLQFTVLQTLNALVLYPLLDVASGLNGDWSQVYFGGVPALSAVILACHVGILGGGFWAWRNARVQGRIAALTGAPPGASRAPLGGLRRTGRAGSAPAERVLREAAGRVASGWPVPVEGTIQRRPEGWLLVLTWTGAGGRRAVAALTFPGGDVQLWGTTQPVAELPDAPGPIPNRIAAPDPARAIARRKASLDADALTMALRLTMEEVEAARPTALPTMG